MTSDHVIGLKLKYSGQAIVLYFEDEIQHMKEALIQAEKRQAEIDDTDLRYNTAEGVRELRARLRRYKIMHKRIDPTINYFMSPEEAEDYTFFGDKP